MLWAHRGAVIHCCGPNDGVLDLLFVFWLRSEIFDLATF